MEQGKQIFRERTDRPFDGFEVWDGARRVHVYPDEAGDSEIKPAASNRAAKA